MENQLYIRIRGRVLGPYDQEKLQALAKRGQLSKMHELSEDGVTWVRASSYPDLFAVSMTELALPDAPIRAEQSSANRVALEAPSQPDPPRQPETWHYTKNGVEGSPVDLSGLQLLVSTGQVGPEDLVWTRGMPEWAPARTVSALSVPERSQSASPGSSDSATSSSSRSSDSLSRSLCKAAVDSRPWILFIAITSFVYAALSLIGGLYMLLEGSSKHLAPVVAAGLFGMISGLIAIAGGLLLLRYAGHVGNLRFNRSSTILEHALEALRAFWIFASIVLIVILTFIVFVLVWVVSIAGSLPSW